MYSYRFRDKEEKRLAGQDKKNLKKDTKQKNAFGQEAIQQGQKERDQAYSHGAARYDSMKNSTQGFDPKKRQALQYEAERQIERESENQQRELLGDQSRRGIVGKGGVGYAQRRELQDASLAAKQKARRDLDVQDSDQALKNLAARFNVEQGEASLAQLDKQAAIDDLNLREEKRKHKANENALFKSYSRV